MSNSSVRNGVQTVFSGASIFWRTSNGTHYGQQSDWAFVYNGLQMSAHLSQTVRLMLKSVCLYGGESFKLPPYGHSGQKAVI